MRSRALPMPSATLSVITGSFIAAETFAYLAVRSLRKLPLSFPGTTGVKQPMTGGRLARAPRR